MRVPPSLSAVAVLAGTLFASGCPGGNAADGGAASDGGAVVDGDADAGADPLVDAGAADAGDGLVDAGPGLDGGVSDDAGSAHLDGGDVEADAGAGPDDAGPAGPPPIIETFDLSLVAPPSSSYASWSASSATSCRLEAIVGAVSTVEEDLLPEQSAFGFILPDGDLAQGARVTLSCSGPGGLDSVTRIEAVPRVELFVATPADLDAPGAVELCHDVPGADTCSLEVRALGDDSEQAVFSSLDGTGCVTVASLAVSSRASLSCVESVSYNTASADLVIAVGPTLKTFAVEPRALPVGGGDVEVSWSSYGVTGCAVTVDGDVAAELGAIGTHVLAVADDAVVGVSCDGGVVSASDAVTVGPAVTSVELFADTVLSQVSVAWTSAETDSCALTLSSTAGEVTLMGLPTSGERAIPVDLEAAGYAVAVAVSCTDLTGGSDTENATLEIPHVGSFTADPSVLPAQGGATTLCWDVLSLGEGVCAVFAEGAAEYYYPLAASGCLEDLLLDATRRFILYCNADGGYAEGDVTVVVGQ